MGRKKEIEEYEQALKELDEEKQEYLKLDEDGHRFSNALDGFGKTKSHYEMAIFLLKNNIKWKYGKQNGSIKIGKFIYFTSTYRWRVDGKNKYYRSKGIEDFVERFYKKNGR